MLAAMGFLFVPNSGSDLYRLIPIMHGYSQISFSDIWGYAFETNTPVAIIYMYLIGKTHIDGLLPAITSFISFGNIFYILNKSIQKYKVKSKDAALTLLFLMSSGMFFEVISGIRSMLAFSIIAVVFYKEIYENKSPFKNFLWYAVAGLIHPAALALSIIRISFLLFQQGNSVARRLLYLLLVLSSSVILFVFGDKYYLSMVDKASRYLTGDAYSYLWQYVIGIIVLVVISIMQFLTYRLNMKVRSKEINNNLKFSFMLSIVVVILFSEYNTFHRFVIVNSIISIPMLLYIIQNNYFQARKKAYFKLTIYILALIILCLACTRGNLSSLKFFIL